MEAAAKGNNLTSTIAQLNQRFAQILASSGPREMVLASYRAGLGLEPLVGGPQGRDDDSRNLDAGGIAAVVISSIVAAVLAAVLLVWLTNRGKRRTLFGKARAPRLGPSTTLVVTGRHEWGEGQPLPFCFA